MSRAHLADALSHWQRPIDGLQTSAIEFYAAVETSLKERDIPGIQFARVKFKESGIVSAERIYLRVKRKGLFFDIGAAPFGTGYFFSWWMARSRPSPILGTLLAAALVIAIPWLTPKLLLPLWYLLHITHLMGILRPVIYVGPVLYKYKTFQILAMIAVFALIRRIANRFVFFDGFLSGVPILGPLYKWCLARDTYYSVDTMLMYQSLVSSVVTEAVDKLMTAKGMRALTEDEKKPAMRSFLKKGEPQKWTATA